MGQLSRRQFIGRTLGVAAGAAVAGIPGTEALAKAGRVRNPLLTDKPGPLASNAKLKAWNEYLAGLGARHTGNPSQLRFTRDIRQAMDRLGWHTQVKKQTFESWEAKAFGLDIVTAGSGRTIPVASPYPYSGRTSAAGIKGELAYAGSGKPNDFAAGDFAGKIAVIDVSPFSLPISIAFNLWDDIAPADVDISLPYDRAWVASGPDLAAAKAAGAIGAVIILAQSPDCAKNVYAPFGTEPQGLPALNVDAVAGDEVRALAKSGGHVARLRLTARKEQAQTWSLLATLKGASDDVVVVNTHTDGTNLIEENGPLAMISMAQRLSARKRSQRPSTIAFYFATGHFQYEVESSGAYVTEYPSLFKRTKAGLTIEHLGCPEYQDDHRTSFVKTGKPEISGLFASTRNLAEASRPIIARNGVTRCSIIQPLPLFFGEGAHLHEAGIPMLAYIAGPDYLLAERNRKIQLQRFDLKRMAAETRAMSQLLDKLSVMPKTAI